MYALADVWIDVESYIRVYVILPFQEKTSDVNKLHMRVEMQTSKALMFYHLLSLWGLPVWTSLIYHTNAASKARIPFWKCTASLHSK